MAQLLSLVSSLAVVNWYLLYQQYRSVTKGDVHLPSVPFLS